MSKAHLCYPYSIHSITVRFILNDGKFVEDTAFFNVKSNINEEKTISVNLFEKNHYGSCRTTCYCRYGNDKIILYTKQTCDRCGYPCPSSELSPSDNNGKITYYPRSYDPHYASSICNCCGYTCIITETRINPYYRESDFIPREPYRDPNAPITAAIFGAFFGILLGFILGPGAISIISWTTPPPPNTTVLTCVLVNAVSSYLKTSNSRDGQVCINLPTINVGNCNGRDLNEIGIPIYLKESDYQHFETNTSKSDLINKINNHPITTLIAQYPRLFKKT